MNFLTENLPMINNLSWFIAGVLCYRLSRNILGYRELHRYAKRIDDTCLILVGRVFEDLLHVRQIKHDLLKEVVSEPILKELMDKDALEYVHWKAAIYQYFRTDYPAEYLQVVQLRNWAEALGDTLPDSEENNT